MCDRTQYMREYRQRPEVKEREKNYRKKYRLINKERINKYVKEYNEHPEVKERIKKQRIKNRIKINAYCREYFKNPTNLAKKRESNIISYYKNRVENCRKSREYRKIPHIRERRRLNAKKYNDSHKKEHSDFYKKHNQKSHIKEKIRIRKRVYTSNPEVRKHYRITYKEWKLKNPDKIQQYGINYFKKHLEGLGLEKNKLKYAFLNWSKTIKKLDNNICKLCNSTENLHAHHIMPKAKFPELSLDLNNGITLCKNCHYEVHGLRTHTP